MTDKDLTLADCLSKVLAAIGAVHVECVATKTEGMTREQMLIHIDNASKSVLAMHESFKVYLVALKGSQNG